MLRKKCKKNQKDKVEKNMNYEYKVNVRDNEILRESFNRLTRKTFAFDFEDWYQRGYWGSRYIPHVLLDCNEVIANVSSNEIDFMINGQKKRLIQLGTVMTDDAYRKQGLGRYLMEKVLEEYKDNADGIYLFGNDSVLEYYPKFGFQKYEQIQYYMETKKTVDITDSADRKEKDFLKLVDMSDAEECSKVLHVIQNNVSDDKVLMVDNLGLYMFYLAGGPMGDMVYRISSDALSNEWSMNHDASIYVVLERDNDSLMIHQIFSAQEIDRRKVLDFIYRQYADEVSEIVLGFTPAQTDGLHKRIVYEEDSTFWGIGDDMKRFEAEGFMFPTLSHA